MSDIMSVIASAYATAPLTPTTTKYTNVDSKSYQGTWEGIYSNNQKFKITISDVNGFRAQVKYQSGSSTQCGSSGASSNRLSSSRAGRVRPPRRRRCRARRSVCSRPSSG